MPDNPETNPLPVPPVKKLLSLQQPTGEKISLFLTRAINRVLIFLSLRHQQPFWGMVYDSVTKQPLDPAIIKLSYVDEKGAQTCVTDMEGRYGFLAVPGKFKILASKANYTFPSRLVSGDTDGIFTNLYHGEFFELREDSEVIAPNIPMDPAEFDWNQQAKQAKVLKYPYRTLLIKRVVAILFWFVFALAALMEFKYMGLNYWLWALLGIYFIILACALFAPPLRLWGMILDGAGQPVAGAQLALYSPLLASVVLGKATSYDDGKFLLRTNPGDYILKVMLPPAAGSMAVQSLPLRVYHEGVVNSIFYLS